MDASTNSFSAQIETGRPKKPCCVLRICPKVKLEFEIAGGLSEISPYWRCLNDSARKLDLQLAVAQ